MRGDPNHVECNVLVIMMPTCIVAKENLALSVLLLSVTSTVTANLYPDIYKILIWTLWTCLSLAYIDNWLAEIGYHTAILRHVCILYILKLFAVPEFWPFLVTFAYAPSTYTNPQPSDCYVKFTRTFSYSFWNDRENTQWLSHVCMRCIWLAPGLSGGLQG